MAAVLRAFNLCTLSNLAPSHTLIQEESDDLGLVDVAVVRIDLDEGLDLGEGVLGEASAIDLPEHLDELITINHALIYLLIILLELGEHLVDLLFDEGLETVERGSIDQREQLLCHLRLAVQKL